MYTVSTLRSNIKEAFTRAEKGEEVGITKGGKIFILSLLKEGGYLVHPKTPQEVKKALKKVKKDDFDNEYLKYGCGCNKLPNNNLCQKHHRV